MIPKSFYFRSVAGKHVSNLPDCVTCKDAMVHLQPPVQGTEITDQTKSRKTGDGKGLIELRARDKNHSYFNIIYIISLSNIKMIFNPIQVTCSNPKMVLYFNGKNYPGLMTKPEPYKVYFG